MNVDNVQSDAHAVHVSLDINQIAADLRRYVGWEVAWSIGVRDRDPVFRCEAILREVATTVRYLHFEFVEHYPAVITRDDLAGIEVHNMPFGGPHDFRWILHLGLDCTFTFDPRYEPAQVAKYAEAEVLPG